MEAEDVLKQELFSRGDLGQWDEVSVLQKVVHYGEDYHVTAGLRQA